MIHYSSNYSDPEADAEIVSYWTIQKAGSGRWKAGYSIYSRMVIHPQQSIMHHYEATLFTHHLDASFTINSPVITKIEASVHPTTNHQLIIDPLS